MVAEQSIITVQPGFYYPQLDTPFGLGLGYFLLTQIWKSLIRIAVITLRGFLKSLTFGIPAMIAGKSPLAKKRKYIGAVDVAYGKDQPVFLYWTTDSGHFLVEASGCDIRFKRLY